MKKKIFKVFLVVLTMSIVFNVCAAPAAAVSYGQTPSAYPYQEECFGSITIYPVSAVGRTYCELESAGKWVAVQHWYWNKNGNLCIDDARTGDGPNSFTYNNEYSLTVSTGNATNFYITYFAKSQHSVRISRTSMVGWYYFDKDLDDAEDYDNPDYHWFYVYA